MVTFKNETTINILKKMVENPKVTIVELAKQLGISENAIQKQLKSLQEKGYLQRNGKTRGGSWQVLLVSRRMSQEHFTCESRQNTKSAKTGYYSTLR